MARETGLSESQVYKWGWDQKNKKQEEEDEREQEEQDEKDEADRAKEREEAEQDVEQEKDKSNAMQLDLAISQVVINNDELNHGIILPHKMGGIAEVSQNPTTEEEGNKSQDK